MSQEEKSHEKLPVYEVEFIPVERRLQDRRSQPPAAAVPVERRQQGRRKTDLLPEPDEAPDPAGDSPASSAE